MLIKLLISGQPNSGKTTLLKSLNPDTTLVISRDGKRFPYPIPHKHINDFFDVENLVSQIGHAIASYIDKFDRNPETIVIDSISKILLDIEARVLTRVKSFPYGVVNTEITRLTEFLENEIASNCNLIMVSHTLFNPDTATYELVNAGGSWGRKGGMISEVENALFIEIKNKKRIIHHKHPQLPARSILENIEDHQPIEEYDLQKHVNALMEASNKADKFELD